MKHIDHLIFEGGDQPDTFVKSDSKNSKFCICLPFSKGMPAVAGFTILCLILSIVDAFTGDCGIFSLLFIAPQIPASILMGQYLKENNPETRSKLSTGFCLQAFACLVALGVHIYSYIKKHPDVYNSEIDVLSTEDALDMQEKQDTIVNERKIAIAGYYTGFILLFVSNWMFSCAAARYKKVMA